MTFNYDQQSLYFLIYGFLAWVLQAVIRAAKDRQYANHGLLTLPIDYEIGLVFFSIVPVLPTMGRSYPEMYLFVLATLIVHQAVLGFIGARLTKNAVWMHNAQDGTWQKLLKAAVTALIVLLTYLLIQPSIMNLADAIPPLVLRVANAALDIALVVDFVTVLMAMRRGQAAYEAKTGSSGAHSLSDRIYAFVWKRLEKAYPGIHDQEKREKIVFAGGASLDKMVWVFLSCALLGDAIETVYCRLMGGTWMSRSSVIIGPFTLVWGLGAVVLTIALLPLSKKNDRWVFLGGAIFGGAFEYVCSVFAELMFGTVFWDYSYMGALSIGGRTNIPFMLCRGVLGVVWVKILYPPLARLIERMPVVPMKIATWLIVVLMAFNGLFTMEVMLRFNARQEGIVPANRLEVFVDETYDDDFVKERWPNMIVVKDEPAHETADAAAGV